MNKETLRDELLRANEELAKALEQEEKSGQAIDSMERRYWEGYTEALGLVVESLIRDSERVKI
jgi:hypothetical protein